MTDFKVKIAEDILGGIRGANIDAGAEEFGANGISLPYDQEDVGIAVGFGASSNPTLLTSDAPLAFDVNGGTTTFEIISNVDWEITTNLSGLDFDVSDGTGSRTVAVTSAANTTGSERTGTIFINEVSGGNGLSTELSVVQLNTFLPLEIQIVGTTSLGTQDKEEIAEENIFNDDLSNYWTGNPDEEEEVSITMDLSCLHELTEIGINFWKADERTTTFSIEVAKEVSGPFTTILDTETSAENSSVGTEQMFSLNNTIGRFVKFVGIGNSSSTNWTSIANINIYGNVACASLTSVFDDQSIDPNITIFPVPTTNGTLNISSTDKQLNGIEIYNVTGQHVLTANGNGDYSKQIDISSLNAGIYILKLEALGHAKFIVR